MQVCRRAILSTKRLRRPVLALRPSLSLNAEASKCLSSRFFQTQTSASASASANTTQYYPLPMSKSNLMTTSPCRHLSTATADDTDTDVDAIDENEESVESSVPYKLGRRSKVRNVAIVAHVDHGKTTLVDELLKATSEEGGDRLMDSGDLEKERGITITSKVTRMQYGDNTINVVDTPGHADFAGEVDRILSMVDGVCLVVDASEGPMAQTKYVLSRALNRGLLPIVVLNKADRADGVSKIETGETESQILDLFDALGATDQQMDYLTLFASARQGWVTSDVDIALKIANKQTQPDQQTQMNVLFQAILDRIPEPVIRTYQPQSEQLPQDFSHDPFALAATTVGFDQYLGRTCTGRIYSGSISLTDDVVVLQRESAEQTPPTTLAGLFVNRGISRIPLEPPTASAGDIVTLVGVPDSIAVGDTVTGSSNPIPSPIDTPPLAPPTLSMDFGSNNGPFAGKEGTIVTSSRIRSRLLGETDNNVTIAVQKCETDAEKSTVFGRGELQLGILIEQMRREGFEMVISPPKILTSLVDGVKMEPFEEVTVDVDTEYAGTVVNALTGDRKGVLLDMQENSTDGKTRLMFDIPSRGLLGFGPEVATLTRGTAVVNHCFLEDRAYAGNMGDGLEKGKLVSSEQGKASQYALSSIVERGTLFIQPGDMVYAGMVIGEYNRAGDLEVNPVRAKATTNVRSVNKEEKIYLPPPKLMNVEELIGYMNEDEIIEVTPKSIRLRKAELDAGARQRQARSRKKQMKALKDKK